MIHTPDNQGFAGRCNRGLATARGRFVCFLDGSSVVTVGWLDCLVGLALHDWPSAGLVGPMTNLALPPQAVRMEEGLAGLDDFAAQYRRGHAGLMFQVNRLSGFCLLAARDVLDHVGGLDERFGAGLYADADLCLRVREAGLRLLIAQDVFVYQAPRDSREQSGADVSFDVLKEKWGAELAESFRPAPPLHEQPRELPPAVTPTIEGSVATVGDLTPAPAPMVQPGVTLCMIVRNEEANLPECLRTTEGLFQERILVDTGSTDATREVASPWREGV